MYSTRWFRGVFAKLPGVGCDNFTDKCLDQYFLSHCHADHMEGLDALFTALMSRNAVKVNHRIFCSPITKGFLMKKYKLTGKKERFVCDLPHNEPRTINAFDKKQDRMYRLRVTLIPANHCPGSVMFLFESLTEDEDLVSRILYTGDFRFENIDLSTLNVMHDSEGHVLPVDEMYLDTTFCSPTYKHFPSREESLVAIWNIVTGWIKKNGKYRTQRPKHVVLFQLPAQYGSEAILRDIYERSGQRWKIHVDPQKFQSYLCSEDLKGCVDPDPNNAEWIHACLWKGEGNPKSLNKIPCQDGLFEVCRIKPSAMYFSQDRLPRTVNDPPIKCDGGNVFRVCYSSHSSLTELKTFVKYFQPKKVFPCDMPKDTSFEEVCHLLASVLDTSPNTKSSETVGQSSFLSTSPMSIVSSDEESDFDRSKGRKRKGNFGQSRSHTKRLNTSATSDDELDEGSRIAQSKRLVFQRSRQDKGAYSMPVEMAVTRQDGEKGNRRASLPHSLKIPVITITPSSPSPDINDPDYPEFFEDKPYLESKHLFMSTSVDSSAGDDLKMITDNTSSTGSLESTKDVTSSGFSATGSGCQSTLFSQLRSKSFASTVSITDPDDYDMLQSTPEFDEILANAEKQHEILNCIKFREQENRL